MHSFRYQPVEVSVGVCGVMVERHEMFYTGKGRKGKRVLQRTVAPANVLGIFLRAVLGVMDEEISVSGEPSA